MSRATPFGWAKATLISLGVCALLASCGPLISFGDSEPDRVYSLRYPVSDRSPQTGPMVFVSEPSFADGLGGQGVRARLSDFELTTIKNLRWSTDMSALLRDYMVQAFRELTGAQMLGEDALDVRSRCRLNLYVWEMAFKPGASASDDRVAMRLELSLVGVDTGALIGREVLAFEQPVSGDARGITSGFNRGLQTAVTDIGQPWLSRHLAACSP